MGAYHQMGHDSVNLLGVPELSGYVGAILSPVNYIEADVIGQIKEFEGRQDFDTVLDPQLYYPKSDIGKLSRWSYYPSNVDTADIQSEAWWNGIVDGFIKTCTTLSPSSACSPAPAAQAYNNDYYSTMTSIGNRFAQGLAGSGIRPVQTVIASLADLSQPNRPLEVSSIVSRTQAESVFLVFVSDIQPRRELKDTDQLLGGMRLIEALENAGLAVTVGYTSSEVVLWKYAGASHCCTGKFFNLRRFTKSRFDEPAEGGGQLPYWFEESLLAFLRESDVGRVRKVNMLSATSQSNPFFKETLTLLSQGQPWLAKSWRFYLYAFYDLEDRIEKGKTDVSKLLEDAEKNWPALEDKGVLMEEARNNGDWIRPWRRALKELQNPIVSTAD